MAVPTLLNICRQTLTQRIVRGDSSCVKADLQWTCLIRQLDQGSWGAESMAILDRMVEYYGHKITSQIVEALLPSSTKAVCLKDCPQITEKCVDMVVSRCSHLQTLDLTENSSNLDFDKIQLFQPGNNVLHTHLTSVVLEDCPQVMDEEIQALLKNAPSLQCLNIARCSITDKVFLLNEAKQLAREAFLEFPPLTEGYDSKLQSVDVSRCKYFSSTGVRHLCTLCGPTLSSVNLSWTKVDCTSLLYLSGLGLPAAVQFYLSFDFMEKPVVAALMYMMENFIDISQELTSQWFAEHGNGDNEVSESSSTACTSKDAASSDNATHKDSSVNVDFVQDATGGPAFECVDAAQNTGAAVVDTNDSSDGSSTAHLGGGNLVREESVTAVYDSEIKDKISTTENAEGDTDQRGAVGMGRASYDHDMVPLPSSKESVQSEEVFCAAGITNSPVGKKAIVCRFEDIETVKISGETLSLLPEAIIWNGHKDEATESAIQPGECFPVRNLESEQSCASSENSDRFKSDSRELNHSEKLCKLNDGAENSTDIRSATAFDSVCGSECCTESFTDERTALFMNENTRIDINNPFLNGESMISMNNTIAQSSTPVNSESNTEIHKADSEKKSQDENDSAFTMLNHEAAVKSGTEDSEGDLLQDNSSLEIKKATIQEMAPKESAHPTESDTRNCSHIVFQSTTLAHSKTQVQPFFTSNITSLCINGTIFEDELMGIQSFRKFLTTNCNMSVLKLYGGLTGNFVTDNVMEVVGAHGRQISCISIEGCDQVTSLGVTHLIACKHLTDFDLTGVAFVGDSGISPLVYSLPLSRLLIAETRISSTALNTIVARPTAAQLKELDLSWCEDMEDDDGLNKVVKTCSSMERLMLRECICLTTTTLELLAQNCHLITELSIASNMRLVQDASVIMLSENMPLLEKIDLGWNSHLTNKAIHALMDNCRCLKSANLEGLKLLTSAPFVNMMAVPDLLYRYIEKVSMHGVDAEDSGDAQSEQSELEPVELRISELPCLPHRSTVYSTELRYLHLKYSDFVEDSILQELVAVTQGSVKVIDYYGEEVEEMPHALQRFVQRLVSQRGTR